MVDCQNLEWPFPRFQLEPELVLHCTENKRLSCLALKQEGVLPHRVRLRQCKFLNNIVEQSHRNVKKRTWLAKSYKRFHTAWRTLEGIETMEMIRKGRVRWVAKKDVVAEVKFIAKLFPIAA